jgi:hypothetical protein
MALTAPAADGPPSAPTPLETDIRQDLRATSIAAFREVRAETERRANPLSAEDQAVQSMPDASPTKWHRAHTTWFFEQFLLAPHSDGYRPFDERFGFLFNSYYVAAGPRHARPKRGLITRPSSQEVAAYRAHVDAEVEKLIGDAPAHKMREILRILEIGLNHEQQHQELMLTDILHVFAENPDFPAYDPAWKMPHAGARDASGFVDLAEGIRTIGHQERGFCFDNERPAHRALVGTVSVARGLVTNGDWLEFIADGGYERPELWLSDGWATVVAEGWTAPGYWDAGGPRPGRSGAAGLPHQLLRGRCLRALGRQASAGRGGVGGGGARRRARRGIWGPVAMDPQRLFALSGLSAGDRRARRVQRQVHGQPDGAAGQLLRNPARACTRQLPQFLPSLGTLAVHRTAAR